ncbi:MAG: hypothetical protein N3D17_05620 [bacterium]|nr:hypothetical protein [bacterium]
MNKKFVISLILLLLIGLVSVVLNSKEETETGTIRPVIKVPLGYSITYTQTEEYLLNNNSYRFGYVRGYFDGLQMGMVLGFERGNKILKDLEGMRYDQVQECIDKFYKDYPIYKDQSPLFVINIALPNLRKGLPPFPTEKENSDSE